MMQRNVAGEAGVVEIDLVEQAGQLVIEQKQKDPLEKYLQSFIFFSFSDEKQRWIDS